MSRLYEPLNDVFGSQSKIRLLRAFASASRPLSGREAARRAKVGATPALRALAELVGFGVVVRSELEAQNLYELNRSNRLVADVIGPAFSREQGWTEVLLKAIAARIRKAAPHAVAAYVFGSVARGEDVAGSDFDVLVLMQKTRDNAVASESLADLQPDVWHEFGLRMAPVVVSVADVRRQANGALLRDVRKEGRRLFGPDLERLIHGQGRTSKAS